MRTFGFGLLLITTGIGVLAGAYPNQLQPLQDQTQQFAEKAWTGIEANPTPVIFALSTFILTVVYHMGRGKSLKESVGMAAIRTPILEGEASVVRRVRDLSTKKDLLAHKKEIEDLHKILPSKIVQAEKDVAWAENEVTKLEDQLFEKRKTLAMHKNQLSALLDEQEQGLVDLIEIEAELKKLV